MGPWEAYRLLIQQFAMGKGPFTDDSPWLTMISQLYIHGNSRWFTYKNYWKVFPSPPVPCKMAPWRLGNSSLQHPITAASCCSISASQTLDKSFPTTILKMDQNSHFSQPSIKQIPNSSDWECLYYYKPGVCESEVTTRTLQTPKNESAHESWLLCLWSFAHEVFVIQSKHMKRHCLCRCLTRKKNPKKCLCFEGFEPPNCLPSQTNIGGRAQNLRISCP